MKKNLIDQTMLDTLQGKHAETEIRLSFQQGHTIFLEKTILETLEGSNRLAGEPSTEKSTEAHSRFGSIFTQ